MVQLRNKQTLADILFLRYENQVPHKGESLGGGVIRHIGSYCVLPRHLDKLDVGSPVQETFMPILYTPRELNGEIEAAAGRGAALPVPNINHPCNC